MTLAYTRRSGRNQFLDYYAVLDVPPNAAFGVIESAYWKKAYRAASTELDLLNEAFEVLGNARKRESYDAERELNGLPLKHGVVVTPTQAGGKAKEILKNLSLRFRP